MAKVTAARLDAATTELLEIWQQEDTRPVIPDPRALQ